MGNGYLAYQVGMLLGDVQIPHQKASELLFPAWIPLLQDPLAKAVTFLYGSFCLDSACFRSPTFITGLVIFTEGQTQ